MAKRSSARFFCGVCLTTVLLVLPVLFVNFSIVRDVNRAAEFDWLLRSDAVAKPDNESRFLESDSASTSTQTNKGLLVNLASADDNAMTMTTQDRTNRVCHSNITSPEWRALCQHGLIRTLDESLVTNAASSSSSSNGNHHGMVQIIQIGAHTGFEANDPISIGLAAYLQTLDNLPTSSSSGGGSVSSLRQNFHWAFVEPSPPNYARLQKNMDQNLCQMQSINKGVIPDTHDSSKPLTFYTISDAIDPETGYDSLSKQVFPHWITQISSLTIDPIKYNEGQWKRRGLKLEDYLVQTNVTVARYSDLVQDVLATTNAERAPGQVEKQAPDLVLIDTEGFDCKILKAVEKSSRLARFIVFEHIQCKAQELNEVIKHLEMLGYSVYPKIALQNSLAVLQV